MYQCMPISKIIKTIEFTTENTHLSAKDETKEKKVGSNLPDQLK